MQPAKRLWCGLFGHKQSPCPRWVFHSHTCRRCHRPCRATHAVFTPRWGFIGDRMTFREASGGTFDIWVR